MTLLVEAKWDGRLGDREAASVDRHLATCASCAALAVDLDSTRALLREPVAQPSPLDRQRNRMKLLRETVLSPVTPARSPRRRIRAVGLLAAAAIVLLALVTRSRPIRGPTSEAAPPASIISVRTVTTVSPEGPARFTRSEVDGSDVVTLLDGGVSFSVRHLAPGERFVVKTSDAEVEVRGTVFRVEAADERIQRVSVVEGKVEVRFRGSVYPLSAGELWSRPVESSPLTPAPRASPTVASSVSVKATRRRPIEARPTTSAKASLETSAGDLAEGVGLMRRGDYGAAADRLDTFSKSHPDDDRAEDAAFLVIVAMQRAGRRVEAVTAARRYIARYPSGYRREEAEAVIAAP
jgi:hypothetical protein